MTVPALQDSHSNVRARLPFSPSVLCPYTITNALIAQQYSLQVSLSNLQPGTSSFFVRIVAFALEESEGSLNSSAMVRFVCLSLAGGLDFYDVTRALRYCVFP